MGENHVTTTERYSTAADQEHSAVSFQALAWVAQLRGVTWSERGVLLKLADLARKETGLAWPSVDTIAKWAGVDERTVRRILGKLLERGLIEVAGANNRGGGRGSTTYRMVIPSDFKPGEKEDAGVLPDKDRGDIPVRPGDRRGDISVRGGGTPESPEPIKRNLSSSSVLTDGAPRRAKRGQGASRSGVGRRVDPAIQGPETEAIPSEWERTGRAQHEAQLRQATGMLLALQPRLNRAQAESEVWGLKLKYDHTWEPVIGALAECGQIKPPPAHPLRWLLRHAARHGNRLVPDF